MRNSKRDLKEAIITIIINKVGGNNQEILRSKKQLTLNRLHPSASLQLFLKGIRRPPSMNRFLVSIAC